jgi:hypothetical protein
MTELSPQAQAVLDAVREICPAPADEIAAALRAAATQIEPTQEDRAKEPGIHSQVFFNGIAWSAVQLLAIAAELEADND